MDDSDLQKYEELKLYEKIHGTPISKLKPASAIGQHDLFVLTKRDVISSYTEDAVILDESQDGAILLEESDDGYLINEDQKQVLCADCESRAVEYQDLCAQVVTQVENMVRNRIGSMAFESRDDYAKVVHDHDDIYSRLDIGWHAVLPVSASYKLMTVHLSNFLEDGTVVDNTFDIVGPSAIIEYDTAEDIGTLRFTGVPKLDSGKIVKYGTKYNIDIMDPDFDGWVYPNGTTFSVTPGEFRDACEVYGDDDSFTVPNLESFIKANPGTMTEQAMSFRRFSNGLPKHSHKARNLKVEVTPSRPQMTVGLGSNSGHTCLCGWGEQSKPIADINFTVKGSLNEATINGMNSEISDSRLDVEQKPNHLLMPVMVFIGRRNRD